MLAAMLCASGSAFATNIDEQINNVVAPIVNPFVGMIFSTISAACQQA